MRSIDRARLKQWLDEDRDIALVEVLDADKFRKAHLPGAINVPLGEGFDQRIQQAFPDKNQPLVVYCYDQDCQASPKAAARMDELGFQEVYDYQAGKVDWQEAGLPVERGRG